MQIDAPNTFTIDISRFTKEILAPRWALMPFPSFPSTSITQPLRAVSPWSIHRGPSPWSLRSAVGAVGAGAGAVLLSAQLVLEIHGTEEYPPPWPKMVQIRRFFLDLNSNHCWPLSKSHGQVARAGWRTNSDVCWSKSCSWSTTIATSAYSTGRNQWFSGQSPIFAGWILGFVVQSWIFFRILFKHFKTPLWIVPSHGLTHGETQNHSETPLQCRYSHTSDAFPKIFQTSASPEFSTKFHSDFGSVFGLWPGATLPVPFACRGGMLHWLHWSQTWRGSPARRPAIHGT